jgi:RHS repeat-associated protein
MGVTVYTVLEGEILSENRRGIQRDYIADPLGSVVGLLDSTQTVTDTVAYWPYGEIRARSGTNDTPFLFVGSLGYRIDTSTRTYVRAREYEQAYGRWMTVDPLWPDEEAYAYVDCEAPARTDSSGMGCVRHHEYYGHCSHLDSITCTSHYSRWIWVPYICGWVDTMCPPAIPQICWRKQKILDCGVTDITVQVRICKADLGFLTGWWGWGIGTAGCMAACLAAKGLGAKACAVICGALVFAGKNACTTPQGGRCYQAFTHIDSCTGSSQSFSCC